MKKSNKPVSFKKCTDETRIAWGAGMQKLEKKPSWWSAAFEKEVLSTEEEGTVCINQPGTTEEIASLTQSMRQFFHRKHKKKITIRRLSDGDVLVWVWSQRDAEAKYHPFGRD